MKIYKLRMYKCKICGIEVSSENDIAALEICSGCY